jgi:hypothetical protein
MGEMMEKLKPYLALLLLSSMLPLLVCCGRSSSLPDYRGTSFSAELRWESEGQTVSAIAEYGPPTEGEAPRELSLFFTSPDALKDARLVRRGERVTFTLHGLTVDGASFDSLLSVAELLLTEGVIESVCDTEWEGLSLRYAEIKTSDGRLLSLWLDPSDGAPKRLQCGNVDLTVLHFSRIDPQQETKETDESK